MRAHPPGTTAWTYFRGRMATRHALRRQLHSLAAFLDVRSVAAFRPPASITELREVETGLQMPLPPALFELFRSADGQEPGRGAPVHFFDASRLLSAREMLAAAQGRLATARAFQQLCRRAQAAAAAAGAASGRVSEQAEDGPPSCSSAAASGSGSGGGGEPVEAPQALLPLSEEMRGRRRYCMDVEGRVWLVSGWNARLVADSLPALIASVLT